MEAAPQGVGDEAPKGGYDCPTRVDNGNAPATHDCALDARCNIVDAHQQWVILVAGKQGRVNETGTDIGNGDIDVLLVGKLVEGLEIGPLVAL